MMISIHVFLFYLTVLNISLAATDALNLSDRPVLKYGTAWKKDRTSELVYKAIKAGFRHVDTACQPRHYDEKMVGDGWKRATEELGLKREDIWLQTKFSGLGAHEEGTEPYDIHAPLEERVRQSLQKSIENLQTVYLDSWIMHGLEDSWEDTFEVYRTMEEAVDKGLVKQIGISNVYRLEDVEYLFDNARVKPKVVQNRFYADSQHDVNIRAFCKEHDIEYQSFWTLTANPHAVRSQPVLDVARRSGLSPEGVFYAFCMALGISPLDGTTDERHMKEDAALMDRIRSGDRIFESREELVTISELVGLADFDTEEEL